MKDFTFYRTWRRFFVDVWIWPEAHKYGFGFGRYPLSAYGPMPNQYATDDVPHPFADPDALTGNITTPAGAQSSYVIDVTKGPYVPNWPSNEDGS